MSLDPKFISVVESLQPSLDRLCKQSPIKPVKLGAAYSVAGVYLLSEEDRPLYVGRTNNLRRRMQGHCSVGATHNRAAFAFRLARVETGNLKPTYKPEGSRRHLMGNPGFFLAFSNAKTRIRNMDLRFVEEAVPVRQAVLEMYVAVVLGTPYNDFDNH